ncbi:MAG: NADH-quinone oxidoreductase subunit C [Hyphomicrobiales bacterium]|nr:NADH-quinone oxidoreductase subunit C [Hyphomicrobiales bacterium]MCP5371292.1 NADH-quinone oxidoreductase subunit C [Hyphomicrobiales bacterium]
MKQAQVPAVLESVLHEIPGIQITPKEGSRVRVDVAPGALPAILELLKGQLGFMHLSAISCIDWPQTDEFELVYTVWSHEQKMTVSAHVTIPRDPGEYVSVYDIHTPAGFFERDIHEMFGVRFDGSPNLRKFILTSWNGPPPMLKSFDTLAYVEETFQWVDYRPEWLRDIEAKGGGIDSEGEGAPS